jgi:succinyl-CoA synthetase beta subunit
MFKILSTIYGSVYRGIFGIVISTVDSTLTLILFADPNVKAILVNVFGGIVNCATIANGIVNASQSMKLEIPLVVRLEGM